MEQQLNQDAGYAFAIEPAIEKRFNIRFHPDPALPRGLCQDYLKRRCKLGKRCPHRHPPRHITKDTVCKHWTNIINLCKKGDKCEFLHEYNSENVEFCQFHDQSLKEGREICTNPTCDFRHRDLTADNRPPCDRYTRGMCKTGRKDCKYKHVKEAICPMYLTGFCPFGSTCSNAHPRFSFYDRSGKRFNDEEGTEKPIGRKVESDLPGGPARPVRHHPYERIKQ